MAHKIDTPNAVASMPVAAAAATPGWFADNNPLSITDLDADWCNMVQGELTNIVTAFGGTLTKGVVNQIATALTEYVLTNGKFSTTLKAVWIDTLGTPDWGLQGFYVETEPVPGVFVKTPYWRVGGPILGATFKLGWDPATAVTVIDGNRDAGLRNIYATGTVSSEGDLTVKGKVKNASGADVVFDDGVLIEEDCNVTDDVRLLGGFHATRKTSDRTCDWATTGDYHFADTGITLDGKPIQRVQVVISNSTGAPTSIGVGESVYIPLTIGGFTITGAICRTIGATTNPGKGSRWAASVLQSTSLGGEVLALTNIGPAALSVAGAGSEIITVECVMTSMYEITAL